LSHSPRCLMVGDATPSIIRGSSTPTTFSVTCLRAARSGGVWEFRCSPLCWWWAESEWYAQVAIQCGRLSRCVLRLVPSAFCYCWSCIMQERALTGVELVHTPFRRLLDILLCDLYACLFALAGLWHETGARKCGACRVPGQRVTHCPLNVEGNVRCRCSDHACGPCSASCAVCNVVGHQPDNLKALIVGRAGP